MKYLVKFEIKENINWEFDEEELYYPYQNYGFPIYPDLLDDDELLNLFSHGTRMNVDSTKGKNMNAISLGSYIDDETNFYVLEFDEEIKGGHDGNMNGTEGHCWIFGGDWYNLVINKIL